jgi:16S rRNA (cytosine1402-N4)-methyltransferase
MAAIEEEYGSASVHKPVLLNEVITFLDPKPGDSIVDGTVDGGGHAAAIVDIIGPKGNLLGLDWDERLLERCKARFVGQKNVKLIHGNYAELPELLAAENNLNKAQADRRADGLLIDLGFSSEQLEASGRGFSFGEAHTAEPLLMTYDDSRTPVWQILREESEESLANIIFEFGGERKSRRIAKAIKDHGRRKPIMTSGELADVVREALTGGIDGKSRGKYEHGRIDPATRTFQAFRIYANGELENLKTLLKNLGAIVKPGGRVAIISFHSTEDGIVKRAFQSLAKEGTIEIITKKPVEATREEIKENPRSRSAKIRAAKIL